MASLAYILNPIQTATELTSLRELFGLLFLLLFLLFAVAALRKTRRLRMLLPKANHETALALFFLLVVFLSHEFIAIYALFALFLYVFLRKMLSRRVRRGLGIYFSAGIVFCVLGFLLFLFAVEALMPGYLQYSRTAYGLLPSLTSLFPFKQALVAVFWALFFHYAYRLYRRHAAHSIMPGRLLYWLGIAGFLLLLYPVGWAPFPIVYLAGLPFIPYFFTRFLRGEFSQGTLLMAAFFIAATILSRNAFIGLDFFMHRFEAIGMPVFLLVIAAGLADFVRDFPVSLRALPFPNITHNLRLETVALLFVFVLLLTNGQQLYGLLQSYQRSEWRMDLTEELASPYFKELTPKLVGESRILLSNRVQSLFPNLPNTIQNDSVWNDTLPNHAPNILLKWNIGYLVVKAVESTRVVTSDYKASVVYPTFGFLQTIEFDRLYDAGDLQSYKFDREGRHYYDVRTQTYSR